MTDVIDGTRRFTEWLANEAAKLEQKAEMSKPWTLDEVDPAVRWLAEECKRRNEEFASIGFSLTAAERKRLADTEIRELRDDFQAVRDYVNGYPPTPTPGMRLRRMRRREGRRRR